jgi:hypothetical protein
VAQELLAGPEVGAAFQQVGGERMVQRVGDDGRGDTGRDGGVAHGPLDDGLVRVVAAAFTGGRVEVVSRRAEDPLPGPVGRAVG